MRNYIVQLALLLSILSNNALAKDATIPDTVKLKSYTRKDGTVVQGYTRKKKESNDPDTVEVKG